MSSDDLRAAVQAGIITEAQAASVGALAAARADQRAHMPAEDEPFEFFKGFSEIFISLGLVILLSGVLALLALIGGWAIMVSLPLICAAIAWWWANYFTLKRRMNLPSMVLALAFGVGIFVASLVAFMEMESAVLPSRMSVLIPSVISAFGMGIWYRRFRLPFSAFIAGLFVLLALYSATASFDAIRGVINAPASAGSLSGFFDITNSPIFATATLVFGLCAFCVAMWFDMRDPYRLGRYSATAFWLHLLAAPALVNTLGVSLMNQGTTASMWGLSIGLALITLLALIVDRRSFLTAAIAYIAIVLFWLMGEAGGASSYAIRLLILGALITALGTWWVQIRSRLMTALPDFPGKDRLPPFSRPL